MSGRRRTLSKSADYLDSLANALRDLGGPTTIPHELAQNADDAGNAAIVRFTVTDEALFVWNDGTFTDCGEDTDTCGREKPCDLHSFRRFAGGTKANDAATTGEFGVGFTSVYRITDKPELLYGDEHWLLDEAAPEDERLRACDEGCGRDHGQPGTTFVLPWAREPSPLREKLQVSPIGEHDIAELENALLSDARQTPMFLQNVGGINVGTRSGDYSVTRRDTEEGFTLRDGQAESRWLTLRADFSDAARQVIDRAGGLINPARRTDVTIAIPVDEELARGALFATLPTATSSGLPGHVNATFYPTTDRKSVRFETDYGSAWNCAAIEAVGVALASAAEKLVDSLGVQRFWELLGAITDIERRSEGDRVNLAGRYVHELKQVVPGLAVVETIDGGRVAPRDALLPADSELYDASTALKALGLPVVAQSLHRRLHTSTVYTAYEIRQLTARHVVEALADAGFTEPFESDEGTLSRDAVLSLLDALDRLPGKVSNVEGIGGVAVVPCRGGKVAPADQVFWPDSDADGTLFEVLVDDLLIADVAVVEQHCPGLRDVCTRLDIESAARVLRDVDRVNLESLSDELLDWLSSSLTQTTDDETRELVRQLPIFPTASGFEPLAKLSLPDGIKDPVGVATLVADHAATDYHKLLTALGARPLDIVDYFRLHAIPAVQADEVSVDQATDLLRLAAAHQFELDAVRSSLAGVRIVPCRDGRLHSPSEVHLQSQDIETLAPELPVAATVDLPPPVLEWLGVSKSPSDAALAVAVQRLSAEQGEPRTGVIEAVLRTLQNREERPANPPDFLNAESWLPLRRGGWLRPGGVLPTNARQLYGTQGAELGIPAPMQTRFFSVLTWLGMPHEPPISTVVAHLRHCAENGLEMHQDVYRVLSYNADDMTVRSLKNMACVHVGDGRFVPPTTAFWRPSPFGRWGATLPDAWLAYKPFFDAVGVQQEAGPTEVAAVLHAILDEYGTDLLDESATEAVRGCWTTLSGLLDHRDAESTLAALGRLRSTPDARGILARPDQLYFEDSRALHKRFRLLEHNVIPRSHGTWQALVMAGVRRVDEVIRAKLVDVEAHEDQELPATIAGRLAAFHRVFDDEQVIENLRELTVRRAPTLNVTYEAELFGQHERIGAEPADAIYLPDEDALYYADGVSARAWAREIARAIAPDEDPGPLAMRMEPILSASSSEEAHAALDDYGIAQLDTSEHEVAWTPTADPGDVHTDTDADTESGDGAANAHQAGADGHAPDADRPGEAGANSGHSQNERQDARSSSGSGPSGISGGSGSDGQKRRKAGVGERGPRTGRQTRLRSYVVETDEDEGDIGTVGDEAPDLSPIDLAGVERVLAYERRCGREPREMAHSNAGFDVESHDKHGELVRRIEIKSTGSTWSVAGVMVSRRQHTQAVEDGDLFWLYVVENALDGDYRIYRIQNPASRIDYFGFDGGWKDVAEPDIDRDGAGTPTAVSTRRLLGR